MPHDASTTAPPPLHGTSTRGTPLRFWHWPSTAGRAWGSVVFLHGWGDHGARNGGLARRLAARGLSCHALDFAGHGASPGPRAAVHDFGALVADLHRFLGDVQPVRPRFLCGHSMGGCLAARYAIEYPAAFDGVVFCSAALAINRSVSWSRRGLAWLLGSMWPRLPLGTLKTPAHMATAQAAQARYAGDSCIHHGGIDAGTARALLLANAWLERHRGRLGLPFLALQGEADTLVAPDGPARLARAASGPATLRNYPGARHDLCLELGEDAVAAELLTWMRSQVAGGAAGHVCRSGRDEYR